MTRIALAAGLLSLALVGSAGTANAASFGVYVGNGHAHYRHHHDWRHAYAYEPRCRLIVRHRINRWGERVTVRRRICD
jgi:hypothetical protein